MKSGRWMALALSLLLTAPAIAASKDDRKVDPRLRRLEPRRVRPTEPRTSVALQAVKDCEGAREILNEVAVERALEFRYGYYWWSVDPWSGAEDVTGGSTGPTDYTTTNNQEQGVDEIDIVKTKGTHIFMVEEEWLRRDLRADRPPFHPRSRRPYKPRGPRRARGHRLFLLPPPHR